MADSAIKVHSCTIVPHNGAVRGHHAELHSRECRSLPMMKVQSCSIEPSRHCDKKFAPYGIYVSTHHDQYVI